MDFTQIEVYVLIMYEYRCNLYVGCGDVEEIVHVCVPDHAHVRDDHRAEVALVTEHKQCQEKFITMHHRTSTNSESRVTYLIVLTADNEV